MPSTEMKLMKLRNDGALVDREVAHATRAIQEDGSVLEYTEHLLAHDEVVFRPDDAPRRSSSSAPSPPKSTRTPIPYRRLAVFFAWRKPIGTSQRGLSLIKSYEGPRLQAYQDSVGVWTIGYGTTRG